MNKGLERLKNKNLPCSNCKELKALEIIKKYYDGYGIRIGEMSKEEYDLLKEVLL